jgi:micrococcal nuclease
MAAFLVRALDLTDDGGGNSFQDDDDSVFETDIAKLAAAGITRGCNPPVNDLYCPDSAVTRGQMAAFLVRAMGYTDGGGGNLFVDDDGSVFENDIDKLGTAGVTKGCNPTTNDRYCPDDPVKRDQMASFLTRALGLTALVPPPSTTTISPPGVGCAGVEIIELNYDAPGYDLGNPNGEWVTLRNNHTAATDMNGCTLHDVGPAFVYTFSGFSLAAGAEVQLFSGHGTDTATELYWGTGGAIWKNRGETATLRNVDNSIVDTFTY